jgi:hypothetical protein
MELQVGQEPPLLLLCDRPQLFGLVWLQTLLKLLQTLLKLLARRGKVRLCGYVGSTAGDGLSSLGLALLAGSCRLRRS